MRYLNLMIIFLFISCSEHIHKEMDRDFPNNQWKKNTVKTFDFIVHDTIPNYDLTVLFTHIAHSPYDLIPLEIKVTSPNQNVVSENILIRVKDSLGNNLGDCVGDYCDIETLALTNLKFGLGKHTVKIKQHFPGSYLPNVIALGVETTEHSSR